MPREPLDLLAMLREPTTRQVLGALARGEDPRDLAVDAATRLFKQQVAKALGAAPVPPKSASHSEGEIVDVEYRVIDVTPVKPGVKKRSKGGSP